MSHLRIRTLTRYDTILGQNKLRLMVGFLVKLSSTYAQMYFSEKGTMPLAGLTLPFLHTYFTPTDPRYHLLRIPGVAFLMSQSAI